tara:strand:- start:311 stop:523 length:213 start_codon:yes stop_codon:yes gene_type:complete
MNLKSTDSIGYDKITSGYKIKCNAFLPDLSTVNCLETVSIEYDVSKNEVKIIRTFKIWDSKKDHLISSVE